MKPVFEVLRRPLNIFLIALKNTMLVRPAASIGKSYGSNRLVHGCEYAEFLEYFA